mgnify:CR=1 FL=1
MPLSVFISHSMQDLAIVYELDKWLRMNGINCYIAESQPQPGVRLSEGPSII